MLARHPILLSPTRHPRFLCNGGGAQIQMEYAPLIDDEPTDKELFRTASSDIVLDGFGTVFRAGVSRCFIQSMCGRFVMYVDGVCVVVHAV